MIRHREPSDEEINNWLARLMFNYPIRRKKNNHWQIDITSPIAFYTLDIVDHGGWISFGTTLLHDVQGAKRDVFYREVLKLNAKLNGVKVGVQGNVIILTGEVTKSGLDPFFLAQSLAIFQNAHQIAYPYILEQIRNLGLRLVK